MKVCPILIHGTLSQPLRYDFGRIEKITQGTWEICICTLAFHLVKKPRDRTKKEQSLQKPIDKILEVYCNYVGGVQIQNTDTVVKPYCISQFHLKLNVGQKKLLAYKSRDNFVINNPTKVFELTITDSNGESLAEDIGKYISVSAHILFKRTS